MWQDESLEHYRQFQLRSLQIRDHSLRSGKVRLGFRKPVCKQRTCLSQRPIAVFVYILAGNYEKSFEPY